MVNDQRAVPLTTAYVTAAVCSAGAVLYTLLEIDPHPFATLVMGLTPIVTVLFWLHEDARATKAIAVHDWGLLLWVAWPVLMPWYALKTRGRRGWLLVARLSALMFSPWIAAIAVSLLWWLVATAVWYIRGGG